MTNDLVKFISDHNIESPILLGHSMGGKAVMATALHNPNLISKLVVVDMPPVTMHLSSNFATYVDAMRAIDESNPTKQSEADKILSKFESNVGIRMFLLTNLKRNEDGELRFRVPYELLGQSLESIGGFLEKKDDLSFNKPTLFIAGGNSPYLEPFEKQEKEIKSLFPNSELKVVEGAGHWGKLVS
jgi:pimeloyl-ACP methyl ester carboxylesterase